MFSVAKTICSVLYGLETLMPDERIPARSYMYAHKI